MAKQLELSVGYWDIQGNCSEIEPIIKFSNLCTFIICAMLGNQQYGLNFVSILFGKYAITVKYIFVFFSALGQLRLELGSMEREVVLYGLGELLVRATSCQF